MAATDRERWNARYREAEIGAAEPARVLAEHRHLLPASGRALDLAAGLGANSLALAAAGLTVTAWDVSDIAMAKLAAHAQRRELPISAEARDVVAAPPAPGSFDVIVVSRFLERTLAPALTAALRPAGLLFYQTYNAERVSERGPSNPAYRLAPNELLRLFAGLHVVVYREEGLLGDHDRGLRDEALLIAQRRD